LARQRGVLGTQKVQEFHFATIAAISSRSPIVQALGARIAACDVVSQFPRADQEIDMSVAVEIELGKIRNRFGGTAGRHFARPHETP
jgi:hypothetical protein